MCIFSQYISVNLGIIITVPPTYVSVSSVALNIQRYSCNSNVTKMIELILSVHGFPYNKQILNPFDIS